MNKIAFKLLFIDDIINTDQMTRR